MRNKFAALENLQDKVDVNSACDNIGYVMIISVTENLDYC
jgi:hypothetical protein